MHKVIWSGLADKKYYDYIAKYCLPSWESLPGEKYIVHDSNVLKFPFVNVISQEQTLNRKSKFQTDKVKTKTNNFWKKMQAQVWAIRNLTNCDFLVLLDTDIEVLNFDKVLFDQELKNLKKSNCVWATGQSNRNGHDSGFIILNMQHSLLNELTNHYENIWESKEIYNLRKPYDGDAVESMINNNYPSYKIPNIDYGSGFHVYNIGFVHYGSKIPKSLRANHKGPAINLVSEYTRGVKVKKLNF